MYIVDNSLLPYNEVHITYKIKKEDTLQIVAQKLKLEPRAIRAYHNLHCRIPDLIEADFPYHLEYLILAPEKKELTEEEREQKRTKVIFNNAPYTLSLNHSQINNSYGVVYTIENGEKSHAIKQEFTVKWKAKSENGFYFFEVNRIGKIYINDEEVNTMAEEIAEKASAALYPLLVVVDENGKWVHINNFEQIEERWTKAKKEIQQYYKGDYVEQYFSIYDKNLEDSDTLYLSMSKDWFLNAFFKGIHIQYPSSLSLQKEMEFPFIAKNENIKYQVVQKVDDFLDADNFLVIDINGELNDERTKTDFENALNIPIKEYSDQKPKGNYRAKYFLNPQNYMPESIFISCSLEIDVPQKYSISISNLNDTKELTATKQELFIEEIKPQKKWWQF